MRDDAFAVGDLVVSRHTYNEANATHGPSRSIIEGDVGLCIGFVHDEKEAFVMFGMGMYWFYVGNIEHVPGVIDEGG